MEKRLEREYSTLQFEKAYPSCMRGIFNFFDFHQRLHIKKMLSDKKYGNRRHGGGDKTPRTKLNVSATGEADTSMDEEEDSCLIEDKTKDSSPSKQSGRPRIKTLIAEEMSKEKPQKRRTPSFSARLLRTESIHYSDYDPDEKSSVGESPRIGLHSHENSPSMSKAHNPILPTPPENLILSNHQCEVCGARNGGSYSDHSQLDVPATHLLEKQVLLEKLLEAKEALLMHNQSKEFLEALQIFNANRELLLKILQDPNSILENHLQASHTGEVVLTKCGSFPGANLPGRNNPELVKHNHKQGEIWSILKQERKVQSQNSLLQLNNGNSSDSNSSKSMPLAVDADGGTGLESLPGSTHELKKQKDNGVVLNRFKDIKQKLKHAIRESKKERLRISMDGILHRIPYGRKPSKDAKSVVESPRSSYESDTVSSLSGKNTPNRIRRASSLNESLDRYSQLFESTLSKEGKVGPSEGSKLGHDDGALQPEKRPAKTFGRILSSPEIWSDYPSKDEDSEVPPDALPTEIPSEVPVDGNEEVKSSNADEQESVDTLVDTGMESFVENASQELAEASVSEALDEDQEPLVLDTDGHRNAEGVGVGDELDELKMLKERRYIPLHEQEIGAMKDDSAGPVQPSPISVLRSSFVEDALEGKAFLIFYVTRPSQLRMIGLDLSESPRFFNLHLQTYTCKYNTQITAGSELKPRRIDFDDVDLQTEADAPDRLGSIEYVDEVQSLSEQAHSDISNVQVDMKDEADFNYVRDILHKSRFSIDELLGMWYLPDQPVDPSLFDKIECSTPDHDGTLYVAGGSCDHLLLFDLINEVLIEIYRRSFSCCPWQLCTDSSIRPMPVGPHVLEEVWASISWYLSSRSQLDPKLEYVVARDLSKNDGWMNIQPEAECVGLELEDWILDDLLDEVTYEIAGF
ncbi:uncharacterized protein LOC131254136 [Magnolia sinica]|uniref:uncharacterized protein LOC131254136 n=1 Tax=Magnolia sinica TaxID=86752 RepID=UPI0026586D0B|nr:uncharacterized protein LOC131254136 [Magnolia sinica]